MSFAIYSQNDLKTFLPWVSAPADDNADNDCDYKRGASHHQDQAKGASGRFGATGNLGR